MTPPLTIVGISGSLSDQSSSFAALTIALQGAANVGATTQVFDIRSLDLPFYDPDITAVPQAARDLADAVYAAHGLIWSSPLTSRHDQRRIQECVGLAAIIERPRTGVLDQQSGWPDQHRRRRARLASDQHHGVCGACAAGLGRTAGAADSACVASV